MIPKSILFVCTANVCRSPMAEALLKQMLKKEGLSSIEVFSRGVVAIEGSPMTEGAQATLKAVGIRADDHRSHRLNRKDLMKADLILVMEERQRQMIHQMYPASRRKTFLLKPKPDEDGLQDIADPMGGSPSDYEKSRIEIQNCLQGLLTRIKTAEGSSKP